MKGAAPTRLVFLLRFRKTLFAPMCEQKTYLTIASTFHFWGNSVHTGVPARLSGTPRLKTTRVAALARTAFFRHARPY